MCVVIIIKEQGGDVVSLGFSRGVSEIESCPLMGKLHEGSKRISAVAGRVASQGLTLNLCSRATIRFVPSVRRTAEMSQNISQRETFIIYFDGEEFAGIRQSSHT